MPFPTRPIPTRADVADIYQNSTNILQKTSVSNMVGLLQQINNVSTYAAEIMLDLTKETEKTTERIIKCSKRLEELEKQTPLVEKMFMDNSPQYFYDNPYMDQEYARKDATQGLLFRRDRSTIPVNRRRQEALPPPDFSSLDQFSVDNIPCNSKYSDPKFFLNEWLEAEKRRIQEEKTKRKQKRDEKKARQKSSAINRGNTQKILKIKKKRYDEHGNVVIEKGDEYTEIQQVNIGDSKDNTENKDSSNSTFPNPSSSNAPVSGNAKSNEPKDSLPDSNHQQSSTPLKPPPPKNDDVSSSDKKRPSSNMTQPPIPPPVPSQNPGGPPRPPPVPKFVVAPTNNDNDDAGQQPPPVPYLEQKRSHSGDIGAGEFQERYEENENVPEEPSQNEDNAPITSQKTMPLPAFLAQLKSDNIQAGLRPVPTVNRSAPKDTRSALLTQLQSKKTKDGLKQVKVEEVKKEKENKDESALVAELLKRRGFIDDDDENDDDSDGSGWSE